MSNPEKFSHERLRELEHGKWALLAERLEGKATNADRLGVNVNYILRDVASPTRHTHERNADNPLYAASLMKLILAKKAVDDDLQPNLRLQWPAGRRDETGSGLYDQPGAPTNATIDKLTKDMLAYSGNTAVRVLAPHLGGADGINEYLVDHGYQETKVIDAGNGAIIFGPTTPRESLAMLGSLYAGPAKTKLAVTSRDALSNNQITDHGIRRRVSTTTPGLADLLNKPGDYPGDDDDPYSFMHDVGIVRTHDDQAIGYAIMTVTRRYDDGSKLGEAKHRVAEETVSQMGAEIAAMLLGRNVTTLGNRALRF